MRLPRREFIITRDQGKKYSQKLFSSVYLQFPGKSARNHYAVVLSAKIHKHAVVRNCLKRQIFSLLRPVPGNSSNIIIYPKKVMLNSSCAEINSGLNRFLSEISSQTP